MNAIERVASEPKTPPAVAANGAAKEPRGAALAAMSGFIANSIDRHVGQEIQRRRMELQLDPPELAKALDIPPEDLKSHEAGTLRVDAERLHRIGDCLSVPLSYFFRSFDLKPQLNRSEAGPRREVAGDDDGRKLRDCLTLIDMFQRIDDPVARLRIIRFVSKISRGATGEDC